MKRKESQVRKHQLRKCIFDCSGFSFSKSFVSDESSKVITLITVKVFKSFTSTFTDHLTIIIISQLALIISCLTYHEIFFGTSI